MTDTCKDIDLIATSDDPLELASSIAGHRTVSSAGKPSANGVRLETQADIGVDVRIVEPEAFGNLLQHFTGSAAHNTELRETAVAEGLHVSEHGIKDDETGETERFRTEQEVYERLGYEYIEPELREHRGELAAARDGKLPALIERDQVRGDLHCHTTLSDGQNTLEEMAAAAERLGYEYLAITDHSATHGFGDNVEPDRLRQRIEEIREFNSGSDGIRLLAGTEVNIHPDGTLDYEDDVLAELDWVIASIHTGFSKSEAAMTARMIAAIEHPEVDCIGHATGRLLARRDPYPLDIEAVFEAAVRSDTAFEINGSPKRRDLSDVHARMARDAGVRIVLNTDAHAASSLGYMSYAIATARRAWLEPADVLNTGAWWK